jgi:hypothetical protein
MKGLPFKAKAEYPEPNVVHSLAAVPGIFSSLIVFHTDFLNAIAAADRPPCLSPFIATLAFPSGVLSPVLLVQGFVRLMVARRDRNPFGVSRYDLRVTPGLFLCVRGPVLSSMAVRSDRNRVT